MKHEDILLEKLEDCMDHIDAITGPDDSTEGSRELALAYTKIEEAFLWRARDLAIKHILAEEAISDNEAFND